jgi:hypothetical protein
MFRTTVPSKPFARDAAQFGQYGLAIGTNVDV